MYLLTDPKVDDDIKAEKIQEIFLSMTHIGRDSFMLRNAAEGAAACARTLMDVIRTGEHPEVFGNPYAEEAAQSILSLHDRISDLEDLLKEQE